MKRTFVLSSALILAASLQAQDIKRQEWEAKPILHKLPAGYEKESAIIIRDDRRVEYVDLPNKEIAEHCTYHRIVRLNDNLGIEAYNKIYLSASEGYEVEDIRARTILPDGRIIDVDKANIKDLEEKDGSHYKIFAMEGLEKGSEIEYTYMYKRNPSWFGKETVQTRFPVVDSRLEILAPERLVLELKGYNCSLTTQDTVIGQRRIFSTSLQNIPGADDEKYAAYKVGLKRIEYKLSYNTAVSGGRERVFTWNELAKRVHSLYDSYTEKELGKTSDMIRSNGWDKLATPQDKIIAVENYIKKQIIVREDIDAENAGNLEWIIRNKLASNGGILRLYGAIFERLGVERQLVLTCNREDADIDRSFENWNNTTDYLFYFPATKKLLAPTVSYTRYPWINPFFGGHNGVFCKTTTLGSFTTAIAEIRMIPLEDYTQTYERADALVRLDPGKDTVLVDLKDTTCGYLAAALRAAFILSTPESQQKLIKEFAKASTNSESIQSSRFENANFESFRDNKPFVLDASVKSGELMENTGNKILVKIGEIIGPQTEMYQEKARQFPVMIEFAHTLERTISFQVPDGYVVSNLNDLKIHNNFQTNGEITMGFTSDYTLDGSVIRIHVMEQYRQLTYPLSEYENFRKVINSAADFNKIVLVLEKKG